MLAYPRNGLYRQIGVLFKKITSNYQKGSDKFTTNKKTSSKHARTMFRLIVGKGLIADINCNHGQKLKPLPKQMPHQN